MSSTTLLRSEWITLETAREILARFKRQYPSGGKPGLSWAQIDPKQPLSPELIQREGVKIAEFFFDAKRNLTDRPRADMINLIKSDFSGEAIFGVTVSWRARMRGDNGLPFWFKISMGGGKLDAGLFFDRDETFYPPDVEDIRKLNLQQSFAEAMRLPVCFKYQDGRCRVRAENRDLLYVWDDKPAEDNWFTCPGGYSHPLHDNDITAHCERLFAWIDAGDFEVLPLVEFEYSSGSYAGSDKVTEWYLDLASRFDSVKEWEHLRFEIEIPSMESLLECRRRWPNATLTACVASAEIGESDYINLRVEAGKKGFRVAFEMSDPEPKLMGAIRKLAGIPLKLSHTE